MTDTMPLVPVAVVPPVPLTTHQLVPPVPPAPAKEKGDSAVAKRWTPNLVSGGWCGISSYFLANYHRLAPFPGAKGLTNTEAMLLIQIMDHKWDARLPFPKVATLAQRLGMAKRSVREKLKTLEELKLLKRVPRSHGGSNRIDLTGLFSRLEEMMAADAAAKDAAAPETDDDEEDD